MDLKDAVATNLRRVRRAKKMTQEELGPKLVRDYQIQKLETCWTCHR